MLEPQRGRYGASSHDHDRIDGRDDAGFLGDYLNRVVSVLLASIIDILPHDTSVFYSPPPTFRRVPQPITVLITVLDREHRRKITTNYECDWPAVMCFHKNGQES